APQLAMVVRSVQAPLQRPWPDGQPPGLPPPPPLRTQASFVHEKPAGQQAPPQTRLLGQQVPLTQVRPPQHPLLPQTWPSLPQPAAAPATGTKAPARAATIPRSTPRRVRPVASFRAN